MNSKHNSNWPVKPFQPPNIESFLLKDWWAINEAVYVLAGWPEENLFSTTISYWVDNINQRRASFYLPWLRTPFESDKLTSKQAEIFLEINRAIKKREIAYIHQHLHEGIEYLVRPDDVIILALIKGHIIPDNLQKALHTFQMKTRKFTKPLQKKVRVKITGQYIVALHPEWDVTQVCKDLLIIHASIFDYDDAEKEFWDKDLQDKFSRLDKEQKSLENRSNSTILKSRRNPTNELYDAKGKRGRQKKLSKQSRSLVPEPIPEIVCRNRDGTRFYHFPLLEVGIKALVKAHFKTRFAALFKMDQTEFINDFKENQVFKWYLTEAPKTVEYLVNQIINKAWEQMERTYLFNGVAYIGVNSKNKIPFFNQF